MPGSIADSFGGDPIGVLREIQAKLGRPGTYAGIIGNHFRAGATSGVLEQGEAGKLASDALDAHHGDGAAAVLTDFVDRVGEARTGGGGGSSGGGQSGSGSLILLGLLGAGGGAFYLSRRRRRRQELEQVKHVARDDLVALGDDIRALDMD